MFKEIKFLIVVMFALTNTSVMAFCSNTVAASMIESEFVIDSEQGLVTDSATGLMWSVCNLGETWSQEQQVCTGNPKSTDWQQALQASVDFNLASFSDWRLPNIKELMSIIERQCAEPASNLTLFPTIKSEPYWTSTPVFNANVLTSNYVWAVHFKEGSNHERPKTTTAFTRLVRKVTSE